MYMKSQRTVLIRTISVTILFLWIGCASIPTRVEVERSKFIERYEHPRPEIDPIEIFYALEQDTVITLERSRCEGLCPVYRLVIYGDGHVICIGTANVKQRGRHEAFLLRDDVKRLVQIIEGLDYFSIIKNCGASNPENEVLASDNPTVITSIRIGDKFGRLEHYLGYYRGVPEGRPPSRSSEDSLLIVIENKIDEIANTRRWIE